MKFGKFGILSVLGALALSVGLTPYAHAGCGMYQPSSFGLDSYEPSASPQLIRTGFGEESEEASRHEPSIVGTWKEHWISDGISDGTTPVVPAGAEFDAGYSEWHSDGTEINLSGLRTPLVGNVCLGVWVKTGCRTYRMNHFGVSYDATGQTLIGAARIQQWLTLDEKGMATSGKYTVDQYDESGNRLVHFQGTIIGTRVTIDTGWEKVG